MNTLFHNGLTLPLNDAHVYQRRGIILAYRNQEPLHFTILRCQEGSEVKTYFGAARVGSIQTLKPSWITAISSRSLTHGLTVTSRD